MKLRPTTAVLVAMLVSVPVALAGALTLGDGLTSTATSMKNIDGSMLSIDDVKGEKGTLVIFTCNACPWVKAWEDRIAEIGNMAQTKGVGVIAINPNDPGRVPEDGYEVMQTRAKEKGFEFPYVVDGTSGVARAYGATRTPEVFLFDAEGKLVYHGTIDDNAKAADKVEKHFLRDALKSLIEGDEIPVKETKALGCSIKFRS
jgi:thiol-disulfide isomerase/thioredoxin